MDTVHDTEEIKWELWKVVYGVWEADGGKICRRNAHDSADKKRCVSYERVDRTHFRNSDGVGFCLGPCENDKQ